MEPHKPPQTSFQRTFAWVVAAHVALIIGVSIWSWVVPVAPPPLKFINMVNAGDLVRGQPGPSTAPKIGSRPAPAMETSVPAPAPVHPTPVAKPPALEPQELTYQQQSQPEPAPQPEPEIVKIPAPRPTVPDIATKQPEPTLRPVKPVAVAPKPVAPPRPRIKVDLQEVSRAAAGTTSSASSMSHHASKTPRLMADASDTTFSGVTVAEKLGRSIQASGVTGPVVTGKSGRTDGTDSDAGRYYTLIRDQMYEAWDRPLNLLGRGLCTQVRIVIEKNGAIARVDLKRLSGNPQHDETAMAAVRKVGRIAEPLPDGVDGSVDVNFKLTN
jgi:TonB family protein